MNYYSEIKKELINNELYKKVKDISKNRSDLNTYYNVGKLLSEAGKSYGEGIIRKYSDRLTKELGKGYTPTRLRYFRRFYKVFLKRPTLSDKLSYSHYCEIIWFDDVKINYYIKITEDENLSVRELRRRIKNNEYERLDDKTKEKLIKKEEPKTEDLIKNPIFIKNTYNTNNITEKMLKGLILENIDDFLKELGVGFSYVASEYKIKIKNRYYYADLLLFNYIDNRFVVLELKVTELKKEHFGQIKTYMNYMDKNVKTLGQNPTLGIILCRKDNKYILKYVTNNNVKREYQLL